MSDTNVSEASSAFSRFHLPPSHPQLISKIPKILPHERVFPIQIGSELFKLSGASLSSDGMYTWISIGYSTRLLYMSFTSFRDGLGHCRTIITSRTVTLAHSLVLAPHLSRTTLT